MASNRRALDAYQKTSVDAGTYYADPHTLITMLFGGFQEKLSIAKGAMQRGDFAAKGEAIGRAMDIIYYLQSCLDMQNGGSISENLNGLYGYILNQLLTASIQNRVELLDEVGDLIAQIKEAWVAIGLADGQVVATDKGTVAS